VLCLFASSIVDQLLTWILILAALSSSAAVFREPFLFNELSLTLYVLFAINAGRYAYKTAREVLSTDRASTWYINVIHHVVALLSFSVMAVCREDAVLGLACVLMEAHTVFDDVAYVMRKIDVPPHHRGNLIVAAVGFGACAVARALLPVALLGTATAVHSPLRMSPVPLSVLFTSVIFFALVNVWMVRQSAVRLLRCVRARQIQHLEEVLRMRRCSPAADVLTAKRACNALSNNDVVTFLKNELHTGEMLKPPCSNANVATASSDKNGYKTRIDDVLLEVTCVEAKTGAGDGVSDARTDRVYTVPTGQVDTVRTGTTRTQPTDLIRTNRVITIRANEAPTIHTRQMPTIRTDDVTPSRTT